MTAVARKLPSPTTHRVVFSKLHYMLRGVNASLKAVSELVLSDFPWLLKSQAQTLFAR